MITYGRVATNSHLGSSPLVIVDRGPLLAGEESESTAHGHEILPALVARRAGRSQRCLRLKLDVDVVHFEQGIEVRRPSTI